eukprot:gene416-222_t
MIKIKRKSWIQLVELLLRGSAIFLEFKEQNMIILGKREDNLNNSNTLLSIQIKEKKAVLCLASAINHNLATVRWAQNNKQQHTTEWKASVSPYCLFNMMDLYFAEANFNQVVPFELICCVPVEELERMGILGLGKLLYDKAPRSIREQEMKNYFGRKIAIDASMSIYQCIIAMKGFQDGQGVELTNAAGEVTSHLNGIFARTLRMVDEGIKPIYVFDGKPPSLKSITLDSRRQKAGEAEKKFEEAKEAGDNEQMEKMSKRTVRVTHEQNEEVKKMLTLMGIPVVQAVSEAEAQSWAVGTEDMDALTFGAKVMLRHLHFSDAKKRPILEVHLNDVLQETGLSMDQFIDLCILLGCDYLPKLPGIGPQKAWENIQKYGSIEKIARALFKHPEVVPAEDVAIQFSEPDESGLMKFLVEEKLFNPERVTKGIARLKAAMKVKTQGRLDQFLPFPKLHLHLQKQRVSSEDVEILPAEIEPIDPIQSNLFPVGATTFWFHSISFLLHSVPRFDDAGRAHSYPPPSVLVFFGFGVGFLFSASNVGGAGSWSFHSVVAGSTPRFLPTYYSCSFELLQLHKAHLDVLQHFSVRDKVFDNKFPGFSIANGLFKMTPRRRESYHMKEVMQAIRTRSIWMSRIARQRSINEMIVRRAGPTESQGILDNRFSYKTPDADAYFKPLDYRSANTWPNYWQHPSQKYVIPRPSWRRVPELDGITRVQDPVPNIPNFVNSGCRRKISCFPISYSCVQKPPPTTTTTRRRSYTPTGKNKGKSWNEAFFILVEAAKIPSKKDKKDKRFWSYCTKCGITCKQLALRRSARPGPARISLFADEKIKYGSVIISVPYSRVVNGQNMRGGLVPSPVPPLKLMLWFLHRRNVNMITGQSLWLAACVAGYKRGLLAVEREKTEQRSMSPKGDTAIISVLSGEKRIPWISMAPLFSSTLHYDVESPFFASQCRFNRAELEELQGVSERQLEAVFKFMRRYAKRRGARLDSVPSRKELAGGYCTVLLRSMLLPVNGEPSAPGDLSELLESTPDLPSTFVLYLLSGREGGEKRTAYREPPLRIWNTMIQDPTAPFTPAISRTFYPRTPGDELSYQHSPLCVPLAEWWCALVGISPAEKNSVKPRIIIFTNSYKNKTTTTTTTTTKRKRERKVKDLNDSKENKDKQQQQQRPGWLEGCLYISVSVDTTHHLRKAATAFLHRDVEASRREHMKPMHNESHSSSASEYVKSVVFGGMDGILTSFAIIAAAGSNGNFATVLIFGLSNVLADGFAMGFGEYVSGEAERENAAAERMREEWEVENSLDLEIEEMIQIYMAKGLSREDSTTIVNIISKDHKMFVDFMMIDELGLLVDIEDRSGPRKQGFVMFMSFVIFGMVPLLAYCTGKGQGLDLIFFISCLLTLVSLIVLGAFKGYLVGVSMTWSAAMMALNGAMSGVVSFALGAIIEGFLRAEVEGNKFTFYMLPLTFIHKILLSPKQANK